MEDIKYSEYTKCQDYDAVIAVDLDCMFCDWNGYDDKEVAIILLCTDENNQPYVFCPECRYELPSSNTIKETD